MATTSFGGVARHGELADLLLDHHTQYARWSQDTLANRPAAGRSGRFFYATDTGMTYYDIGTGWVQAVSLYGIVGTWTAAQTFSAATTFGAQLAINVEQTTSGTTATAAQTALALGTYGRVIQWPGGQGVHISENLYYDGTNWKYVNTNSNISSVLRTGGYNGMAWYTAPPGTGGTTATMTSRFAVDTSGNITASGNATANGSLTTGSQLFYTNGIRVYDTRGVNESPTTIGSGAYGYNVRWDFKTASVVGISDGLSGYIGVQTFAPWGDDSGGGINQIAFTASGLYTRYGTRSGGWQSWKALGGMTILAASTAFNLTTANQAVFSFVAPSTGKVRVSCTELNNTAALYVYMSIDNSNYYSIYTYYAPGSFSGMYFSGLTAGATYTLYARNTSSTYQFSFAVEG